MRNKKDAFEIDKEKYYHLQLGTTTPGMLTKIKFWIFSFGLHCAAVYRLGQYAIILKKKNRLLGTTLMLLYYILNFFTILFHHVEINQTAEIGPGFFIAHASNIFIGPINIGCNCSVTHNITIGKGFSEGIEGYPTIGNDVWIGTGATITGKINIGNGATISAGCIISKDVPPGGLAAGNTGRVILKDQDNSKLLRYKVSDTTHLSNSVNS